jgi:hypothetical protein
MMRAYPSGNGNKAFIRAGLTAPVRVLGEAAGDKSREQQQSRLDGARVGDGRLDRPPSSALGLPDGELALAGGERVPLAPGAGGRSVSSRPFQRSAPPRRTLFGSNSPSVVPVASMPRCQKPRRVKRHSLPSAYAVAVRENKPSKHNAPTPGRR